MCFGRIQKDNALAKIGEGEAAILRTHIQRCLFPKIFEQKCVLWRYYSIKKFDNRCRCELEN